jgi:hypothetical protein
MRHAEEARRARVFREALGIFRQRTQFATFLFNGTGERNLVSLRSILHAHRTGRAVLLPVHGVCLASHLAEVVAGITYRERFGRHIHCVRCEAFAVTKDQALSTQLATRFLLPDDAAELVRIGGARSLGAESGDLLVFVDFAHVAAVETVPDAAGWGLRALYSAHDAPSFVVRLLDAPARPGRLALLYFGAFDALR